MVGNDYDRVDFGDNFYPQYFASNYFFLLIASIAPYILNVILQYQQ